MKKACIFILVKDTALANLIRYNLVTHQARQVQVFPSIAECFGFMQKRPAPDFVVADLDLPGMDGTGFLENIHQINDHVKVVFLSPFPDDLLLTSLMDAGAADYIYKSARREDWIHELVKNLDYLTRVALPSGKE
jgi:DNA-binding NarL/FixJ family response regulator